MERGRTLARLRDVRAQQRRLVDLGAEGALPPDLVKEKADALAQEASALESDLQRQLAQPRLDLDAVRKLLPEWAAQVRAKILAADSGGFDLMLRALDLRVLASRDEIQIEGTAPIDQTSLVTIEQTSG